MARLMFVFAEFDLTSDRWWLETLLVKLQLDPRLWRCGESDSVAPSTSGSGVL